MDLGAKLREAGFDSAKPTVRELTKFSVN